MTPLASHLARICVICATGFALAPASRAEDAASPRPSAGMAMDLTSRTLVNTTAYIPSQCYTATEGPDNTAFNPCYTCHVRSRAPNYINDYDLQLEYSFPGPAQENPWTNLFVDRRAQIAAISDADILAYVREDNYRDEDGAITLARVLAAPPAGWDADGDGVWSGYVPDCWFAFDDEGFDRRPDGEISGWRAFSYMPLPATFWPAAGSTDDVLIRLPAIYRQTEDGALDLEIYKVNLAIVEALITRRDVAIAPVDETRLGVDLDKDGALGTAETIAYDWAPLEGRNMSYVGAARLAQQRGAAPLAAGLYPLGTEFLHTVRYIDLDARGDVRMAARIKELRYGVKTRWQTYADLEEGALAEAKERDAFPDRIELFIGDVETGVPNGAGWRYQAFIEDAEGELRPQTFEETIFCMGCHGGVGVTDDSSFAFPRKLIAGETHAYGWYHWTQRSLRGTPEALRADEKNELAFYLETAGAGDEFRSNDEIIERFLSEDGTVHPDLAAELAQDVTVLLFPSAERALMLNKAYVLIVREQSFVNGRDAIIAPPENVHRRLEPNQPTGVEDIVRATNW